jgi:hypothetical protein
MRTLTLGRLTVDAVVERAGRIVRHGETWRFEVL